MKPEKFTVAKVAEALRQSAGILSVAAQRLRCNRSTIYRYLERHAKLRELANELREEILDLGEGVLMTSLKSEDERVKLSAAMFLLKTQGKKRGYVDRQEVEGVAKPPVDPKDMTDEELKEYVRSEGRVVPRPRKG